MLKIIATIITIIIAIIPLAVIVEIFKNTKVFKVIQKIILCEK